MQLNKDFKKDFSNLDDLIYMTPADVAAVIAAPSVGSVYTKLNRGELPEPLIRENRRMRWTVGQIRTHISDQVEAFKLAQAERLAAAPFLDSAKSKRGRPRRIAMSGGVL